MLVNGQAEIWGGFGIQANYSYQDSSTSTTIASTAAQNLLDETYLQYSGTPDRPSAFYKNGRTFVGSVTFKL